MKATKLRQNIFQVLDHVLETGVPAEVERNGKKLKIVTVDRPSRLDSLRPRPGTVIGDPEDLVHLDWFGEWKP